MDATFALLSGMALRMRWHVEVIAAFDGIARYADVFASSPVPVVIDHYGLHGNAAPDTAAGQRVLALLREPHIWMKLSAPYRVAHDPLATRPDPGWLEAILSCAEDRCIWGSDWPHTPPHDASQGPDMPVAYLALDYGRLVDDFIMTLGSRSLADRILRDNPARLYEF
jgi:predicted TIM-barrel fold metal-dependent hydrolase